MTGGIDQHTMAGGIDQQAMAGGSLALKVDVSIEAFVVDSSIGTGPPMLEEGHREKMK